MTGLQPAWEKLVRVRLAAFCGIMNGDPQRLKKGAVRQRLLPARTQCGCWGWGVAHHQGLVFDVVDLCRRALETWQGKKAGEDQRIYPATPQACRSVAVEGRRGDSYPGWELPWRRAVETWTSSRHGSALV